MADDITQERLKELLNYNPDTGVFTRIKGVKGSAAGSVVGCKDKQRGYVKMCLDYKKYYAHRLVWLYMTGDWPVEDIDHINNDKSDNRFSNLRLASRSQNLANKGKQKNNTTGFKCVFFTKSTGRYRVVVNDKHIGYYATPEEAHAASKEDAERIYGEFARTG